MAVKETNYLSEPIIWSRSNDAEYPYESLYDDRKLTLRVNDFPDEHFYTLLVDGNENTSFDDWPDTWVPDDSGQYSQENDSDRSSFQELFGQLSTASRGRPKIFVSYASDDKEKVLQVCERLRSEGYEPWECEYGINVGEHATKTQDAAVRHCDFFLACLSGNYNRRQGEIRRELKLRGWAFCNGQILPIVQNTALFSLLGTTYGGNGQTTFALPDLRGRFPNSAGHGPGLSNYTPCSSDDASSTLAAGNVRERREKLIEDDIFILLACLDGAEVPEDLAEDFKYATLFSSNTWQEEGWKRLLQTIEVGLEKRSS